MKNTVKKKGHYALCNTEQIEAGRESDVSQFELSQ